jgi:organic hydroperoxide reductase OsmC/OhrA
VEPRASPGLVPAPLPRQHFQTLARRARLEVLRYSATAAGVLDKTPAGLAFTSVALEVTLQTAEADAERAETLLRTAKAHCLVANSLKVQIDLQVSVVALAPA